MTRTRKSLLAVGLVLVALAAIASWQIGALVRFSMTPRGAFSSESPPPAPDYADPRSWSALPDRDDAGVGDEAAHHQVAEVHRDRDAPDAKAKHRLPAYREPPALAPGAPQPGKGGPRLPCCPSVPTS